MLYLIGLGLDRDVSKKALEYMEECDELYLDVYTSKSNIKLDRPVIKAGRELLESDVLVKKAKDMNIGILVVGDVFIATTHYSLYLEALKQKVEVKIAHGTSILNYISELGLFQYKFGAIASITFDEKVSSYMDIIKKNLANGWHTLCLLDLKDSRFMDVNNAVTNLLKQGLDENQLVIAYSYDNKSNVIIGSAKDLKNEKLDKHPACLVIPGVLHFMEEEALELWK